MRALFVVSVLSIAVGLAYVWTRGEPPPPPVTCGGGELEVRDGIIVLRLSGSPFEKGRAHGTLCRSWIREWLERVRPREPGVAAFAIETCGERLLPFLPGAVREELEGIAAGAGMTLHEAFFLTSRFELAPHLGSGLGFGADAAVGEGPEVVRLFAPGDLHRRGEELMVVVHEDRTPPLVLVALPGMVGGLLGVSGEAGAALRPMQVRTPPILNGLVWTVLLRRLLESPEGPAAKVTLPASIPMVRARGRVGTLNVAPSGRTWFAAPGGLAAATEAAVTGEAELPAAPMQAERARRILGGSAPDGLVVVRLEGGRTGLSVTIDRGGKRYHRVVRYRE